MEDAKRAAGVRAARDFVRSGMRVGLGTGSTAVWAIREIGAMLAEGSAHDVTGLATSYQAEEAAREAAVPLLHPGDPVLSGGLQLVIDGADEVDPRRNMVKGGGAALLREKVVAEMAEHLIIVITENKRVENLGLAFAVPVEVVPFAVLPVTGALAALGCEPALRMGRAKMGPVITDNGNCIIDCRFQAPFEPAAMEAGIRRIPGVVENGLFCGLDPTLVVAQADGTVILPSSSSSRT